MDQCFSKQNRGLAKLGRSSDSGEQSELLAALAALSDDDVLPIARAFTQFLNLANIAEEYHRVRTQQHVCDIDSSDSFVQQLKLLLTCSLLLLDGGGSRRWRS